MIGHTALLNMRREEKQIKEWPGRSRQRIVGSSVGEDWKFIKPNTFLTDPALPLLGESNSRIFDKVVQLFTSEDRVSNWGVPSRISIDWRASGQFT